MGRKRCGGRRSHTADPPHCTTGLEQGSTQQRRTQHRARVNGTEGDLAAAGLASQPGSCPRQPPLLLEPDLLASDLPLATSQASVPSDSLASHSIFEAAREAPPIYAQAATLKPRLRSAAAPPPRPGGRPSCSLGLDSAPRRGCPPARSG
mmetsp:Transcript_53535/g.120189  ORF Transcript_53535/g.120189 Transcript_53535/m.120189 type:complete len:150 (+) Transcript_53535:1307-1756(+)